jgi:hypothetical protein
MKRRWGMEKILEAASWYLFVTVMGFIIFMAGVQVGKKMQRDARFEMLPPWAEGDVLPPNTGQKEF